MVDRDLAEVAINSLLRWRMLQEIAGIHTTKIEGSIRAKLIEEHQRELEELKEDYEMKTKQLTENMQHEYSNQLQKMLKTIAGY